MKYQRREITITEHELPPPETLTRPLAVMNPELIATTLAELDNLELKTIRLDGDAYDILCVTGRFRGADCIFRMTRTAFAEYDYTTGVISATPNALRPTADQCHALAPWLTALAMIAFDDRLEENDD